MKKRKKRKKEVLRKQLDFNEIWLNEMMRRMIYREDKGNGRENWLSMEMEEKNEIKWVKNNDELKRRGKEEREREKGYIHREC